MKNKVGPDWGNAVAIPGGNNVKAQGSGKASEARVKSSKSATKTIAAANGVTNSKKQ